MNAPGPGDAAPASTPPEPGEAAPASTPPGRGDAAPVSTPPAPGHAPPVSTPPDEPEAALGENWASTYAYRALRIASPRSLDELREIVAAEPKVRALGTRHSFTALADSPGVLVRTTQIPADLVVADDRRTITVGGGTRYAELAPALEARGLALNNMGSLPHISIAGATATGTHGSGTALGSLAADVRGLEIVGPAGELRTVALEDADFGGSVIGLGLVGIVTRVTLAVRPSFRLRQDPYVAIPWSSLADGGLRDLMASAYSVSLFVDYGDEVRSLVKTVVPDGVDDIGAPDAWGGGRREPRVLDDTGNATPQDGSVGPWPDRLPHFRVDRVPSVGEEIQSEWVVDLDDGFAALSALRELAGRIRPHLHTTEVRTMAPDGLWLSTTRGRESLALSFTWKKHPFEVAQLLPVIDEVLRPFDARPHWGKMTAMSADDMARLYPRLGEFRELVARVDPARKFGGAFADRLVFGR